MDAGHAQPVISAVGELVGLAGLNDHDIAPLRINLFSVNSEPDAALMDDKGLGVRMPVWPRAFFGLAVDEEHRDSRPKLRLLKLDATGSGFRHVVSGHSCGHR